MARRPSYETIVDAVRAMGPGWHFTEDVLARLESQGYSTNINELAQRLDHLYRHEGRLERDNEESGRQRAVWRVTAVAP